MNVFVFTAQFDSVTQVVACFSSEPTRDDCWAALKKVVVVKLRERLDRDPTKEEVIEMLNCYIGSEFDTVELRVTRPHSEVFGRG